jgi:hypothetical protein
MPKLPIEGLVKNGSGNQTFHTTETHAKLLRHWLNKTAAYQKEENCLLTTTAQGKNLLYEQRELYAGQSGRGPISSSFRGR